MDHSFLAGSARLPCRTSTGGFLAAASADLPAYMSLSGSSLVSFPNRLANWFRSDPMYATVEDG